MYIEQSLLWQEFFSTIVLNIFHYFILQYYGVIVWQEIFSIVSNISIISSNFAIDLKIVILINVEQSLLWQEFFSIVSNISII